MKEIERTFLAKSLPPDLKNHPSKEIIDIYIPKSAFHPILRLRKLGDILEITKKRPLASDASEQHEHTISLSKEEFSSLENIEGKKIHKIRYYYPCHGKTAEIDIFQEDLKGLILVDIEFLASDEKHSFPIPSFCLAEVTQESFLAGGMLCGKSYQSIENKLKKFGYSKLFLD